MFRLTFHGDDLVFLASLRSTISRHRSVDGIAKSPDQEYKERTQSPLSAAEGAAQCHVHLS
jgi:hypothetical protein